MSKESVVEKEVIAWNPPVSWVREAMTNAGSHLGSVHFVKRSNGEFRKMSYKLGVKNPSCGKAPSGKGNRKFVDKNNAQMTVYDANKVVRTASGEIIGRGAYRTVPLENVVRIKNNKTLYIIKRDGEESE